MASLMDSANIVNSQHYAAEKPSLFDTLATANMPDMGRKRVSDEDAAATRAIAQRARDAAKFRDISWNDLDKATKQTQGQTSRFLNFHRKTISAALLSRYAKALDVRLEWLRDGLGPMNPTEKMVQSGLEYGLRSSLAELGDRQVARENAELGLDNLAWAADDARRNGEPFPVDVVARVRARAVENGEPFEKLTPREWGLRLEIERRAFLLEQQRIVANVRAAEAAQKKAKKVAKDDATKVG